MQVFAIKDEDELYKAITFLKLSFKWSREKALLLNKNLLINNKDLNIYGYSIKNSNNTIIGAFLLFYQGLLKEDKNEIKIFNMSSWYVDPIARGYYSLLMIRTFINDFSDCLISNLTSNISAYKVLKSFGFRDTTSINRKFNLLNLISKIYFLKLIKYKFIFLNIFRNNIDFEKSFNYGNSKYSKFYIRNYTFEIISSPTIWEKKIGFLYFKIRGTRILWTNNPNLLKSYLCSLIILYFFKRLSFFCTTHCDFDFKDEKFFASSKQIYLPPKKTNFKRLNLAIRSELAFI